MKWYRWPIEKWKSLKELGEAPIKWGSIILHSSVALLILTGIAAAIWWRFGPHTLTTLIFAILAFAFLGRISWNLYQGRGAWTVGELVGTVVFVAAYIGFLLWVHTTPYAPWPFEAQVSAPTATEMEIREEKTVRSRPTATPPPIVELPASEKACPPCPSPSPVATPMPTPTPEPGLYDPYVDPQERRRRFRERVRSGDLKGIRP